MELVWDGFGPPRFQVFEPAARDVWCGLINHARSLPRLGSTRRARELSYRSERPSNCVLAWVTTRSRRHFHLTHSAWTPLSTCRIALASAD